MDNYLRSGPDARPFGWTGDFPAPSRILQDRLEQALSCPVAAHGRHIPARWGPVHRQLAYLERALSLLRHRRAYRGFFCVQQFIGLYACWLAEALRISLPPGFLQPLIYVPRRGIFGWFWRRFFTRALSHPALRLAFCHSRGELDVYRREFPAAAAKFRHLQFTIEPLAPPKEPADPPYLFSAGTSCRDYATLFRAAALLPPQAPPLRVACKAADIRGLAVPSNVHPEHGLWQQAYRNVLAQSSLVIVPLQPLPVSAGQLVFLQAMSAGRPIVATRTPTSCEFLDDTCAWLVPPEDPQALATAIEEAMAHPEIARQKAAAARARFQTLHSPEAIARECADAIAAAWQD
jgi:glycosyltransferase involved in cell wall biosynthesis